MNRRIGGYGAWLAAALAVASFGLISTRVAIAGPGDPPSAGDRRGDGDGPLAGPQGHRHAPTDADDEDGQMPPAPGDGDGPMPPDRANRSDGRQGQGPWPAHGRFRDGPGPEGWPRRFGDDGGTPSPEMIERVMAVLKERLPEWHNRLAQLQQSNPDRFERVMRRTMPIVHEAMALRERNPQLADSIFEEFKLEQDLRGLSERYKSAVSSGNTAEQAAISGEIETRVRRQMELRAMRREAQLKEFAARLQEQQKRLEAQIREHGEQMAKRDQLVAQRVEDVKKGKVGGPLKLNGDGLPGRGPGQPGDGMHRMRRFHREGQGKPGEPGQPGLPPAPQGRPSDRAGPTTSDRAGDNGPPPGQRSEGGPPPGERPPPPPDEDP